MKHKPLLAYLVLVGCWFLVSCVDVEDPQIDESVSELGGGILWPPNQCAEFACVQLLRSGPNHIHYEVKHMTSKESFNIRIGIAGGGNWQIENTSGSYDLWGVQGGAMYTFSAQECDRSIWGDSCTGWNEAEVVFAREPGTAWYDTQGRPTSDYQWAFDGGWEVVNGQYRSLKVCSALWGNATQVGKQIGDTCYFGYGGLERTVRGAMLLWSINDGLKSGIGWIWASNGQNPGGGVTGGYENGAPQYVCRAWWVNGYHPGKTIGDGCNISWGGLERHVTSYYQVLSN